MLLLLLLLLLPRLPSSLPSCLPCMSIRRSSSSRSRPRGCNSDTGCDRTYCCCCYCCYYYYYYHCFAVCSCCTRVLVTIPVPGVAELVVDVAATITVFVVSLLNESIELLLPFPLLLLLLLLLLFSSSSPSSIIIKVMI